MEIKKGFCKRIRCIYWKKRDKGKGRECIGLFVVLALVLLSLLVLINVTIARHMMTSPAATQVVSGGSISESAIKESPISGSAVTQGGIGQIANSNATLVDTSSLQSLLGFMTQESYDTLVNGLIAICNEKGGNQVKLLSYQSVDEKTYTVLFYVVVSKGSVYECKYNMKGAAITWSQSTLTEEVVNKLQVEQQKAEQKKLELEQKKQDKKIQAAKKKEKSNANSTKNSVNKKG